MRLGRSARLAILAAAAVVMAGAAWAARPCPLAYVAVRPFGTCAFTGVGNGCERCQYECRNGIYTWNVCNAEAAPVRQPDAATRAEAPRSERSHPGEKELPRTDEARLASMP